MPPDGKTIVNIMRVAAFKNSGAAGPRRFPLLRGIACLLLFLPVLRAQGPGEIVSLNGFEMYYETHGSGDPLVLLHGFSGSSQGWEGYLSEFGGPYCLIVPDLRGHGRSSNPSRRFTHRQAALDVYALLDHLGIQRFQGIGTSTGGMTLLHMATQQPQRVEAMILVGATSYFPEQAREIMRRATVDSLTPEQWEAYRKRHKRGDEQIRDLRTQFHNFKDSYDDMNFTVPYLSTITARTLIVHGDRDQFFPVEIPLEQYRSIPNSYLWIVPNGGHGPHSRRKQQFVELTLEFLRGDWEKN